MNIENKEIRRPQIGDTMLFGELDTQTVVERHNSTLGPGNFFVRTSKAEALPVIKNPDGTFKIQEGKLEIDAERPVKVVGFIGH
jgi:hypothetical protein